MYVETFDGSFKEQTIDIESNHCCGRGYAAHCLRTYRASKKNTSAQHKRHGETVGIYIKYKLFLSHFNETGIFLTDFHKNTQTERHTDRTKLAVTFHILCTYI
jgi:hypothetical protein